VTTAARAGEHGPGLPPLGLYVHLPWCERKCPYCDFNSYQVAGGFDEARYVAALERDLEAAVPWASGRPVATVFFGGGTPSLFSADAVGRILESAERHLGIAADAEITLEANPGSAERTRFAGYRQAGVNRLSIGVQSFRDDRLAVLGRVHDADDAARAIDAVHAAGFTDFNLDFMFALPGDTVAGSLADLERALGAGPSHLSWYQLTLEPGTAFGAKPPTLPDETVCAAIEQGGRARLEAAGFVRYEVSAWAQPGHEARHNLNYWRFGDYLGVGAGAHGKVTDPATRAVVRTLRPRHPERYMRLAGRFADDECTRIADPGALATEFLMNALRLVDGFDTADFIARTGIDAPTLDAVLDRVSGMRAGWLVRSGGRVRASAAGFDYLDTLLVDITGALEDEARAVTR